MFKKFRNNMMKGFFVFLIFCCTFGSNLFVLAEEGTGTLQISKNDSVLENINGYCFGLYDNNSKDSEPIQYITIDETESANIELDVGTYWIRRCNTPEDKVPDGFLKEIKINVGEVTEFIYSEEMLMSTFANARATYVTATRKNMGWYSAQFNNFALLYMGGTPVFCIQPHQLFSTADPYEIVYTKPNFISDATLRKISLASYYGTEYYKSDKWTATAQSLIWYYMGESWSSCIVDFKDGTTNESMMTTLNNMVNSHTTKPSFDGKTLTIEPGQTITVNDTNGVLDRFVLSESIDGVSVSRNGSVLTITAQSNATKGTYSVSANNNANIGKGKNTYYTTWGTSIHGSDGWQRCGQIFVASSDAVSSSFKIEVKESKGTLNLVKSSSNTSITNGNTCYSLENAVYGVYSNSSCTNKVGELKTDSSGKSNTLTLTAGTYYIKEMTAPKNYKLDSTIYNVSVKSGTLTTQKVTDEPLSDPVRLLLGKVDKETNSNKPSGSKSLQNAQFTFKFYLGDYAANVDPASLGKTPNKTWVIKTDADGYCRLGDAYKVSGDSFWYNGNNEPTLPIGTLTVQETKAPEGYHINKEVYVIKIAPNSTTGIVTYNMPVVKEQAVQFTISKVQEGINTAISGVVFAHTNPKGTVKNYTTNAQGKIVLDGLSVGTHTIKEISTVSGYELNSSEFKFKINEDGSFTKITNSDDFSIDVNGNGVLTVENKVLPFKLKVVKINNHDMKLEGAKFGLYSDKNCQNLISTMQTSSVGELVFEGLSVGKTYYLKELEAPIGYRLDEEVHVYEISTTSNPMKSEFNFYVDQTKYTTSNTSGIIHLEGTKDNRIISITVTNTIGMQLPETGSSQMVWLYALSLGAFIMYKNYRKKGRV